MTATKTPQESLLELWESIPNDLRPSGPCSFDALSRSIASLVEKAQTGSQCGHKGELADALGGIRTANGSWLEMLELARRHAWRSSKRGLRGDMPARFNGSATGYRRWKPQIKSWAIMNETAPGNVIAVAVLRNTSGRAKRWAQSQEPRQYSVIDGAPVSAATTIEALFKDMDRVFVDSGANYRAYLKFSRARQGTRPVFDYNIYYLNLVLELGYDPESGDRTSQYIETLHSSSLREALSIWQVEHHERNEHTPLKKCMELAAVWVLNHPPSKRRRGRRN
ncbi:hypothetical protein ACHAPV_001222 [Trichoderma viride]